MSGQKIVLIGATSLCCLTSWAAWKLIDYLLGEEATKSVGKNEKKFELSSTNDDAASNPFHNEDTAKDEEMIDWQGYLQNPQNRRKEPEVDYENRVSRSSINAVYFDWLRGKKSQEDDTPYQSDHGEFASVLGESGDEKEDWDAQVSTPDMSNKE